MGEIQLRGSFLQSDTLRRNDRKEGIRFAGFLAKIHLDKPSQEDLAAFEIEKL